MTTTIERSQSQSEQRFNQKLAILAIRFQEKAEDKGHWLVYREGNILIKARTQDAQSLQIFVRQPSGGGSTDRFKGAIVQNDGVWEYSPKFSFLSSGKPNVKKASEEDREYLRALLTQ